MKRSTLTKYIIVLTFALVATSGWYNLRCSEALVDADSSLLTRVNEIAIAKELIALVNKDHYGSFAGPLTKMSSATKSIYLNARNEDGLTSLMYAIRENMFDMANLLIEQGADVTIQDDEGHNAFYYAANFNPVMFRAAIISSLDVALLEAQKKELSRKEEELKKGRDELLAERDEMASELEALLKK